MTKIDKEKIRAIYGQLGSLLEQIPRVDKNIVFDEIKSQVDAIIASLNELTEKDYSHFAVIKHYPTNDVLFANAISIRAQLGGLMGRLGSEYFSDEQKVAAPGTQLIFNQSQENSQSQQLQISIVMELQEILTKKESEFKGDSPEGSFVKKLKEALPNIQTIAQLVNVVIATAKGCGLSIESLYRIFGG